MIKKYYPQLLLTILAFSFFTRVYRLHLPEKYMFDEVYHAVTAKLIVDNDIRAYEFHNPPPEPNTAVDWLHPPLAKYTQALSMKIFGKNSFGWRFSSAIFGVLAVYLTARFAFNLFRDKGLSLLAALIVSLDGLVLTMSRIAMNDIHVTVFILMALNFYTIYVNSNKKKWKLLILASLSTGLAIGTKWSGAFALLIIGFLEAINIVTIFFSKISKKNVWHKLLISIKRAFLLFPILILLPILVYILSYSHMFLLGKDFNHLIEMHKNTWWYQTNLDATHPAQSKPIQWFLNTKPVWFEVTWSNNTRGDIYAIGNPLVFWIGDIFILASIIYTAYLFVKLKKLKGASTKKKNLKSKIGKLMYLLFIYFTLWLPWQLSPRIMFFYHYLPAVPLLSINMAFWLNKLFGHKKYGKNIATIILMSLAITFIIWYPHWVGIEVSKKIKNNVYFAINGWEQK